MESIMKRICEDDPEICKSFRCRAWVKLMHPFHPHEFIRSLLVEFSTNSYKTQEPNTEGLKIQEPNTQGPKTQEPKTKDPKTQEEPNTQEQKTQEPNIQEQGVLELEVQEQEQEQGVNTGSLQQVLEVMKATQESMLAEFMGRIKEKPYLIVLEGLSTIVEWNAIKTFLLDMKNESRVVVSTQQVEMASLCAGQPYHVWLLREFSTEHSVYAFSNSKDLPKKPLVNTNKLLLKKLSYIFVHVSIYLLLPFQIISHSKNFGESEFSKFDQIYTTR